MHRRYLLDYRERVHYRWCRSCVRRCRRRCRRRLRLRHSLGRPDRIANGIYDCYVCS